MIKRPVRDQVYTLDTYLKYVQDGDICEDADVQRLAGNFDVQEFNELIYTTLTGDHVPEIILAECNEDGCTYIVDGLQRTTIFKLFRFTNRKITTAIDNPIVEYSKKKRDENGIIVKNDRGQVEFEDAKFNIKNKTYEMLPDELKKDFNDFQIRFIVHEDCTKKRISELVKRYNYHKGMTSSQRAFTYMDNFAVQTRKILNGRFFVECEGYKEKEKIDGTMERVVTESIMYMFHSEQWKKQSKAICNYLNKNSSEKEFNEFNEIVERLGNIVTKEFSSFFTSKNSFIWFKLFKTFMGLGVEDEKFADFIKAFNSELKDQVVNEIVYKNMKDITYLKLDKEAGTKDKILISAKTELLEILMLNYLHINKEDLKDISSSDFVKENINSDITQEDVEQYEEVLDFLTLNVDNSSKLLDKHNHPSLVGIVAYSFENDIDIDDWIVDYFSRNNMYIRNQKENYLHMKQDLDKYVLNEGAA